jgi:hypothetical protein
MLYNRMFLTEHSHKWILPIFGYNLFSMLLVDMYSTYIYLREGVTMFSYVNMREGLKYAIVNYDISE